MGRDVGRACLCNALEKKSSTILALECLKTIEELTGDFQIQFHSKPNADQFIDFSRSSDSQGRRTNTRHGKVGPFPDGQTADDAFLEIFVFFNRANNARNVAAPFDQNELAYFASLLGGKGAGDPGRVVRETQPRSLSRRTDQSGPDGRPAIWLIFPPAFWQIIAFELVGIDRQDGFRFLR